MMNGYCSIGAGPGCWCNCNIASLSSPSSIILNDSSFPTIPTVTFFDVNSISPSLAFNAFSPCIIKSFKLPICYLAKYSLEKPYSSFPSKFLLAVTWRQLNTPNGNSMDT